MPRPRPPDWAAIAAGPARPDLEPGRAAGLGPGQEQDGVAYEDLDVVEVRLEGGHLLECRLARLGLEELDLRRSRLTSSRLEQVRATTALAEGSTWRDVVVARSRLGALLAQRADLRRVSVAGGRLDHVDLRGAQLAQVQLVDCRIGHLDLGGATLAQVRLTACEIGKLVLTGATLAEVDLRSADVEALEGVAALRGATITPAQLTRLAPAFAELLGVRVDEPPTPASAAPRAAATRSPRPGS